MAMAVVCPPTVQASPPLPGTRAVPAVSLRTTGQPVGHRAVWCHAQVAGSDSWNFPEVSTKNNHPRGLPRRPCEQPHGGACPSPSQPSVLRSLLHFIDSETKAQSRWPSLRLPQEGRCRDDPSGFQGLGGRVPGTACDLGSQVSDLPWAGLQLPVALIAVSSPLHGMSQQSGPGCL